MESRRRRFGVVVNSRQTGGCDEALANLLVSQRSGQQNQRGLLPCKIWFVVLRILQRNPRPRVERVSRKIPKQRSIWLQNGESLQRLSRWAFKHFPNRRSHSSRQLGIFQRMVLRARQRRLPSINIQSSQHTTRKRCGSGTSKWGLWKFAPWRFAIRICRRTC